MFPSPQHLCPLPLPPQNGSGVRWLVGRVALAWMFADPGCGQSRRDGKDGERQGRANTPWIGGSADLVSFERTGGAPGDISSCMRHCRRASLRGASTRTSATTSTSRPQHPQPHISFTRSFCRTPILGGAVGAGCPTRCQMGRKEATCCLAQVVAPASHPYDRGRGRWRLCFAIRDALDENLPQISARGGVTLAASREPLEIPRVDSHC